MCSLLNLCIYNVYMYTEGLIEDLAITCSNFYVCAKCCNPRKIKALLTLTYLHTCCSQGKAR